MIIWRCRTSPESGCVSGIALSVLLRVKCRRSSRCLALWRSATKKNRDGQMPFSGI